MRLAIAALLLAACSSAPRPAAAPAPSNIAVPEIDLPAGAAVLLVVDRSGSMNGAKLDAAKIAAQTALDRMPDGAPFGVVAFDAAATEPVGFAPITNRTASGAAIAAITAAGGTNLIAAMNVAVGRITTSSAPVRHIVLVSDGESSYQGVEELIATLKAHHITVSAVALPGADLQLLSLITDGSGGRLHAGATPDVLPEIYAREVDLTLAARR